LLARAQHEGRLPADVDVEALARLLAAVFQGIVLQQTWEPRLDLANVRRAAEMLLTRLLQRATAPVSG
ncbi:MAG TPA: TetR family transcriptional regulator C-terminal domain-containing protein, partial [Thermoanaerobaculia bacterium]|nr:TetR family transcriptional regulator C-terminal domain-containing protein [Thermoanaerobaculia bacterium]